LDLQFGKFFESVKGKDTYEIHANEIFPLDQYKDACLFANAFLAGAGFPYVGNHVWDVVISFSFNVTDYLISGDRPLHTATEEQVEELVKAMVAGVADWPNQPFGFTVKRHEMVCDQSS